MSENAVSRTILAARWGLTPGRVSHCVKAGMPVRPDGLVDVDQAEAWRLENVDLARADGADPALVEARLRKMQADAATAELALAERRGDLVRKGDIAPVLVAAIQELRDAIISVPRDHVTDPVEVVACEEAIVAVLTAFSERLDGMANAPG
jgi:phage terminase Nu1 subunit (DNA packaging protein)